MVPPFYVWTSATHRSNVAQVGARECHHINLVTSILTITYCRYSITYCQYSSECIPSMQKLTNTDTYAISRPSLHKILMIQVRGGTSRKVNVFSGLEKCSGSTLWAHLFSHNDKKKKKADISPKVMKAGGKAPFMTCMKAVTLEHYWKKKKQFHRKVIKHTSSHIAAVKVA